MRYATGLIVASFLVGLGRFLVPGHGLSWAGSYEAFAHILVGWLLCESLNARAEARDRLIAAASLGAITAVELVMFMLR